LFIADSQLRPELSIDLLSTYFQVHRVVQLDLDLKLAVNIRDIWNEFDYFAQDNVIGLAHENQPVYR